MRAIGDGRYGVGEPLAPGVWCGTDRWLEEPVVLKTMPVSSSRALEAEYSVLQRLRHPNIVRATDLVRDDELVYLVLERVEGPDFVTWASEDPRPERVVLGAAAVVRGLQQVHARGVLHRDLSPANVRVAAGELGALPAAKIIDFGLATTDPRAEICGTRGFIAPEVRAGATAQPASDLYALGVMILEGVTGAREAQAQEPRERLLERWPTAHLLAETVADLLRPEPDQRPGAEALIAALGDVAGRPLHIDVDALANDYAPWPPLVGRHACLAQVERLVGLSAEGAPGRLQLAGSGKSRVIEELRTAALLAGLQVHVASDPPMVLRLAGVTFRPDEEPSLLAVRAVDALLGAPAPQIWCLDGLADGAEASQPFVRALAEQLDRRAPERGLWIVWAGALPAPLTGERWEQLSLAPLSSDHVVELAGAMLHPVGGLEPAGRRELAEAIHAASGGDAKRAVELVRAQIGAGLPERFVDAVDLLQQTRRRVARLDAQEQQLLGLLALTPRPVPPAVLARVATAEIGALGGLVARGLITTVAEGLRPEGQLVAEAASALLLEAEGGDGARLHRHYAEAWSTHEPIDPATIGHHLLRAGAAEAGAARLLESPLAPADDLRRAAGELPASSPVLPAVLERLAHAARAAGELEQALAVAERLEAHDRPRARLLRGELLLDSGQPAAALEVLGDVDADVGASRVLRARARVLLGAFAEAARDARAGLDGSGLRPPQRVRLQNVLGLALDSLGRQPEALEVLERAEVGARRLDDPAQLARVLNSQGIVLSRLGRLEEASACYRECIERFRALGDLRLAATSALNLGTLAQRRMALGEALEHYRAAAALGEQGGLETTSAWAAANEANLLLLFGEREVAAARLDVALRWARAEGGRALVGHLLVYRAELLRAEQRWPEAHELVVEARARFDTKDVSGQTAADLVGCELLLRQGELRAAGEVCQRLLERMPAGDPERWWALLLAGKLALAQAPPAHEAALSHLEAALATGASRPTGAAGERDWEILALLSCCYQALQRDDEAEQARRRCRAALDELRRRVPASSRQRFDARFDVREARELLAGEPGEAAPAAGGAPGLRRLLELNKELNRGLSMEHLLPRLLDAAIELAGAERGFVLLGSGSKLKLACSRDIDRESVRRGLTKLSRSIASEAIEAGRPVVVSDATDDRRYQQQLSVRDLRLRAVLCVPLRSRGEVLGALYLDNRFTPGIFAPPTVALAEAFADQAGIAVASARMLEQTVSQREQLAQAKAEVEALNRKLEARLAEQSQALSEVSTRLRHQEEELIRRYNASRIVGRSKPMRRLFVQIDRVKDADLPVFIYGESGTGKELVARAIHYNGPRAAEPFVAVNCGALPAELLESELFGYRRGAFTGAEQDRSGVFEVAGGGTLLLDEVTEMAPAMQVKLLRVLQEGTFHRVGDRVERKSHCRVLSASNQQLEPLVQRGAFREDLFYRLNVITIDVPPLRDRHEDLPRLIDHFLGDSRKRLAPAALAAMLDYEWPGNVRQLENEVARAALLANETIGLRDLSAELRGRSTRGPVPSGLQDALKHYERRLIESALEQAEDNVSLAAERLEIHRVVLHRKIKALGINRKARGKKKA